MVPIWSMACASATDETVKVGSDEVPSVYSVIGEKEIAGTSSSSGSGVRQKEITYAQGAVSFDEMQAYIDALAGMGYVQTADTQQTSETAMKLQLATESTEQGKLVTVDISFDSAGSSVLAYTVMEGELTRY
ncbi:MAG: hypothetical protein ACOYJB_01200 [Christensenellaceae bacterium]